MFATAGRPPCMEDYRDALIRDGFREGYAAGRAQGREEGRRLGLEAGASLVNSHLLPVLQDCLRVASLRQTGRISEAIYARARRLADEALAFPLTNSEDPEKEPRLARLGARHRELLAICRVESDGAGAVRGPSRLDF